MANTDLSLLFRLRGDASGAIKATAETRAAVDQLRQSFGPQLTQTVNVANKTFSAFSDNLTTMVAQRVPLVGQAVNSLTGIFRTVTAETSKTDKAIEGVSKSIGSVATQSGKSIPQIATFLKQFVQIEGQSQKNKAAIDFFGASLGTKLLPELNKAEAALSDVAAESTATGSAIASMAGPIGIAAAAVLIEIAAIVALTKALFDLAKQTAEVEGRLLDLSQQTGVSVETLNALDIILSKVGGNLDSAAQSLITFQRNLADAQDSSSKASKTFERLGVDTTDTERALRDTLKALAAMPEGYRQTDLAAQLFGSRGGKQFLAALKESHGDIDQAVSSMGDLARITTEQAALSDEFNDKLGDLQRLLRGVTLLIGREVIPIAISLLRDTEKLVKDNAEAFTALAIAIKAVAGLIAAPLKGGIIALNTVLVAHKPELLLIVELYERLAAAMQLITNTVPKVDPNAIPKQSTAPIERGGDVVIGAGIFRKKEDLDKLKEALANELDALQDAIGDREHAFQAETEDLRRELERRQIDFKKYIDASRNENERRLAGALADLNREREEVRQAQNQRAIDANDAAKKIRAIDNQERDARRAAAKEKQRLDDEVAAHERKQLEATTDVLRATIDAQLRIVALGDEQRIASLRAQAAARVKLEEDTEREIQKIRLAAIDRESERLKTEVAATASLTDPEEQLKVRARLNLELRVLTTQRELIEHEGERDIEAGRQRDLENERRYADELIRLKAVIQDVQRDASRAVISVMIAGFANRRAIVKEQLKLDLEDEQARHHQALETIRNLDRENRESNRIAEEKLETEAEINNLREAELRRHTEEERAIREQARRDEILAGPFGGLVTGLETGQLEELKNGIQSFADIATVALSSVGAVVNQLASGIGNLTQQWVLLGNIGPNAFRKLVASVLAGVAAQAATLAIMELAYAFAALTPWGAAIYGPAVNHFKSAALFGAVAAATGVAGRGIAGGLFASGSGGAGGAGSNAQSGQLNPLTLARNAGPGSTQQLFQAIQPQKQIVELHIMSNDSHIVKVVRNNYDNNGAIRQVIINDGGHEF